MNNMPVLLAAALMTIAAAIYNFGSSFSEWKDPDKLSGVVGNNLAYYIGERIVAEGVLYPSGDLSDPLLAHRKIVLTHAMNESTTKEVVRKLLYLNAIDNSLPIELYISTQGGWYDSAFTIIDTFHAISAPVDTICIGGCYSAGLILMVSGTGRRVAHSNSHFSAHISYGYEGDSRPFSEQPDRVNAYLKEFSGLPKDWFPLEDDRDYYFTAKQALDYKVVDQVIDHPNHSSKKDTKKRTSS